MELLLNTQEERCRMEVYNEYLRKIPQLLTQLEAVEKMYEKAVLEEQMLKDKDPQDHSVILYANRLASTRQQCRLIFALKAQIEEESTALNALMKEENQ